MGGKKVDTISQTSFDYNACFKSIYYQLYSNSSTSRAERIVSDITKILLCKLIAEQEQIVDISDYTKKELISLLKEKYPQSCEYFDDFALRDNDISAVLDVLNNISLLDAPSHIIGDAFQAIIGPRIRGDKGQFFTPKELVECLVEIISPSSNSTIVDPACGTGGFLTAAYAYAEASPDADASSIKLIGVDKDRDMADMALATTEIISHGRSEVFNRNSLEIVSPKSDLHYLINSADVILTNPPFGAKIGITDESLLSLYEFGYNWSYSETDKCWYKLNTVAKNQAPQILFIELCVRLLKPYGKMAIVLPEGIFGNKTLGFVWAYLKKHGRVVALIDCPRNTFQPSTDTKTNVLIFEKGQSFSEDIIVAVSKNCGHDKRGRVTNSANEVLPNDFAAIAKEYTSGNYIEFWRQAKLIGNYYVPRYLSEKAVRHEPGEYITIGEMIQRGYLRKKSGKEVGSEAYGTGNIPFVRTSDIINFEISSDPTNAVSEEIYQQYAAQQNLEIGDILFIADGRYRIGKTAIITKYNIKSLIQSHIEILSLTPDAPLTPYEFLYCLNTDEVQNQVRSLIFIQSTLGTIGNRINEIAIRLPDKTEEWTKKIHAFQHNIEMRAECLFALKESENSFEL